MQVSPTTLFLVEGCGQLGVAMCWGDGFITDYDIIAQTGISDPNPFFQTLLGKPYLDNVVISPHYYPPSVSGSKAQDSGCETPSNIKISLGTCIHSAAVGILGVWPWPIWELKDSTAPIATYFLCREFAMRASPVQRSSLVEHPLWIIMLNNIDLA